MSAEPLAIRLQGVMPLALNPLELTLLVMNRLQAILAPKDHREADGFVLCYDISEAIEVGNVSRKVRNIRIYCFCKNDVLV